MAKRKLVSVEALEENIGEFYHSLNQSSDLAVVLSSTSFLDACLGALLEAYLSKSATTSELLSEALGTFANRAKLCYSLGLVNPVVFQDLITMAEIRNDFAHFHLVQNFKTDPVNFSLRV